MLTITLQATELQPAADLQFEHSLTSISKWEAMYEKPFFNKDSMTEEESAVYISQMLLTKNPADNWDKRLQKEDGLAIKAYIDSKQTATWFAETSPGKPSTEVVTNELVYYWMSTFKIPFKPCDEWHFNKLMTLIRVHSVKQTKPRQMSRQEQAQKYRELNAQRRAELGTTG